MDKPIIRPIAIEDGWRVGLHQMLHRRRCCGEGNGASAEYIRATQQHRGARHVQNFGNAATDRFDQEGWLGNRAYAVQQLAENNLGLVGFTKESAVEPFAHTDGRSALDKVETNEEGDNEYGYNYIGKLLVPPQRRNHKEQQQQYDGCHLQDLKGGARQQVPCSHAHQNAYVEGALNDNDVGKTERKDQQEDRADITEPLRGCGVDSKPRK